VRRAKAKAATEPAWRDVLAIHPAAREFPKLGDVQLAELATDIGEHGLRVPVSTWRDAGGKLWLLDGINRLDALALHSKVLVVDGEIAEVLVEQVPPETDPESFVISANVHRRHLTLTQQREMAAKLLAREPRRSDRDVGRVTGLSPSTVGKVRERAEAAGRVSKSNTHTDSKGREQPASKPRARQKIGKPAWRAFVGSIFEHADRLGYDSPAVSVLIRFRDGTLHEEVSR
jgi:ParB-like chromosome segregation protein Spo0J